MIWTPEPRGHVWPVWTLVLMCGSEMTQITSAHLVLVKQPTLVKGLHRMTKVESGTGLVLPQREEQPRLRHNLSGPRVGGGGGEGDSQVPVSGLADRVGGLPSSRGSRGPFGTS